MWTAIGNHSRIAAPNSAAGSDRNRQSVIARVVPV
jgi:hypothetical protein